MNIPLDLLIPLVLALLMLVPILGAAFRWKWVKRLQPEVTWPALLSFLVALLAIPIYRAGQETVHEIERLRTRLDADVLPRVQMIDLPTKSDLVDKIERYMEENVGSEPRVARLLSLPGLIPGSGTNEDRVLGNTFDALAFRSVYLLAFPWTPECTWEGQYREMQEFLFRLLTAETLNSKSQRHRDQLEVLHCPLSVPYEMWAVFAEHTANGGLAYLDGTWELGPPRYGLALLMSDRKIVEGLQSSFAQMRTAAKRHLREELTKPAHQRCACTVFASTTEERLEPRSPELVLDRINELRDEERRSGASVRSDLEGLYKLLKQLHGK